MRIFDYSVNMRIFLPILLIVALTVAGVFGLSKFKKKSPPKAPIVRVEQVETLRIDPQTHTILLHSQGTIQAKTQGILSTEVSGKIVSLSPAFQKGGIFKKGDLLLTLDTTAYEAAVAQAKVQIAQAELKLQEEQARSEQALKEWEAAQSLTREKPSDLVLRIPQLALAKTSLEAANSHLKLALQNLDRTKLLAPYNGIIEEKLVEIGQVVAPGTPVAKAYSQESLEVHLPLSALEFDFIQTAEPTEVTLLAETGTGLKSWKAQVDRNTGIVDPRTRFHHVIATIQPQQKEQMPLYPGQFVTAEISGITVNEIYRIPRQALLNDNTVYEVTPEDRLRRRQVHILYREKEYLLVDKGLEPGISLCLTRLNVMNDRMKVKRASLPTTTVSMDNNR